MTSDHKFMEYFYQIFLPNISQNVSFKKILKVVDILHLLPYVESSVLSYDSSPRCTGTGCNGNYLMDTIHQRI